MTSDSDKVSINTDDLRTIAASIGKIAQQGTGAFTNLQQQNPHAGVFDAGRYIMAVFQDRRDGLAQHGKDLQAVFQDMETHLNTIADDYDKADRSNATGVTKLNAQIDGELTALGGQIFDGTKFTGKLQTTQDFNSHDDWHPDDHHSHIDLGPDNHSDASAHNTATVTDAKGNPIDVNGQPVQITDNTDVGPGDTRTRFYGSAPDNGPPQGLGS